MLTSANGTELLAAREQAAMSTLAAPERLLTMTVPREYVHMKSVAGVLLTGWRSEAGDQFLLTGQWPRGNSFFTDGRQYELFVVAETVRQAGLLLAHAEYGVPLGEPFLMHDLLVETRHDAMRTGAAPADITVRVACHDIQWRGRRIKGMRYAATVYRDGQPAATGSAFFTCVSPAVYRRLRGEHASAVVSPQASPVPPVHPELVGRQHETDVVLSRDAGRWRLRIDPTHPVMFDHPNDHVPGMVLMEAARQVAHAVCSPRRIVPVRLHGFFHRYAELDEPCWIEPEIVDPWERDGTRVKVSGHQGGEPFFTAELTVTAR